MFVIGIICMLVHISVFQITPVLADTKKDIGLLLDPYEYYSYQEMTDLFMELALNHSDIMSMESLGRT